MYGKRLRKGISWLLVCAIIIQLVFLNFDEEILSSENIIALKKGAVGWIETSQKEDGSWGDLLNTYNTTQVLKNIDENDLTKEVRNKALTYLKEKSDSNNDDLFRKNSIKEIGTEKEIKKMIGMQNPDGSFSIGEKYSGDILDTLLALEAMLNSSVVDIDSMRDAVSFIAEKQNRDGSFSYTDESDSSTYLTAYTAYVLKQYCKQNQGAKETVKVAVSNANEYLLSAESKLWGTDSKNMRNTLMATLALVDLKPGKTIERIETIADYISDNGSMYEDVELTAMFIKLLEEYQALTNNAEVPETVEILNMSVYTENNEPIKAYTDIKIVPEIIGLDKETMTVSVCLGNADTEYIEAKKNEEVFTVNTGNAAPGEYNIFAIVTDNETGEVLATKKKVVEILKSVAIRDSVLNYNPKAYNTSSGKEIQFSISGLLEINAESEVEAEIQVTDSHNNLVYNDIYTIHANATDESFEYKGFNFMPESEETDIYFVTVYYVYEGKILKTDKAEIKVFKDGEQNRIEIAYETDKQELQTADNELNLNFKMQGIGMSDNIMREPMDIVIILDSSFSMKWKDWWKALEGARIIVDYMQPDDRVLFRYINKDEAITEFSGDKEYLYNVLDELYSRRSFPGTYIYKSVNLSIKDLEQCEDRDKAIYLFTDGATSKDGVILNEQGLIDNKIRVYPLFMKAHVSKYELEEATKLVNHLADITGGVALTADTNEEIPGCVTQLVRDIFRFAGSDVTLTMTLNKNIDTDSVEFSEEPESVTINEDGTTTVSFSQQYISVGQNCDIRLKLPVENLEEKELINIADNIVLRYTDESGEQVALNLDPIYIKKNLKTETGQAEEAYTVEDVEKPKTYAKNVIPKEEGGTDKKQIKGKLDIVGRDYITGDKVVINYSVDNLGTDVEKGSIVINAINIDTKEVTEIIRHDVEIAAKDNISEKTTINTSIFDEGEYLFTYAVVTEEETVTLDACGLKLTNPYYKLKIQSEKGGSIVSEVEKEYKAGEKFSLEAVADEEYVFAGWESEAGIFGDKYSMKTDFIMPEQDVEIKAVFTRISGAVEETNKNSEEMTEADRTTEETTKALENETTTNNNEQVESDVNNESTNQSKRVDTGDNFSINRYIWTIFIITVSIGLFIQLKKREESNRG